MVLPVLMAQLWRNPAAIALNCPAGASSKPKPLSLTPQQAMVSSARIAQVCQNPAATAMKVPSAGSGSEGGEKSAAGELAVDADTSDVGTAGP